MAAGEERKATFTYRLLGFLADLVMLALFLLFGVALLNIIIQTVVLVVGIYREVTPHSPFAPTPEEGRWRRDSLDLLIALVQAAVAGLLHFGFLKLRKRYLHVAAGTGFESFISKRYLLAREGGKLVGLISFVSVLGVAVGTMALIVVISVMDGFDRELVRKFMGVFSHVQIVRDQAFAQSTNIPEDHAEIIIERLLEVPGVVGAAPILEHETMMQARRGAGELKAPAMLRGVDPAREAEVTEFMDYIVTGEPVPGHREIVVGQRLAERLNVWPGDSVYAIGAVLAGANRPLAGTTPLRVVGIFNSGLYDVDDKFVYTTIGTVQEMLMLEGQVNSVHLKLEDPHLVQGYAEEILAMLPAGFGVRTWQMLNPQFFEALWIEKVAMFIILLLIVVVAALNIIGTLIMTVIQKTRDIGVLKSMGAESSSILWIFLYHGTYIGVIGTSLGTAWGLRLCHFVEHDIEKIFELPGGVYGIDRLPVVVDPFTIAFLVFCALSICILASIIPAWQAARLNPVEALRYD